MASNYTFDWDELDVGDDAATTSQFFFDQRHPNHERGEARSSEPAAISQPDQPLGGEPEPSTATTSAVDSGHNGHAMRSNGHTSRPMQRHNHPGRRSLSAPKEFNVVKFGAIYENKRKARLEKENEELKKMREFHSRPAPNFSRFHARADQNKGPHSPKITVPTTPLVLRRHKSVLENRKKKQEEYEASLRPKPISANRYPNSLRTLPFKPQPNKVHTVPEPFGLHSSERGRERHVFDERVKAEMERKEAERAEKQRLEDEKIRKEVRKGTNFKANPNPNI